MQIAQVLIYLTRRGKMNVNELFQIRPTNEEQNDFIITVGKHLATELHFKTREEAEQYIDTPQWDMLLAVVAELIDFQTDTKHNNKNN